MMAMGKLPFSLAALIAFMLVMFRQCSQAPLCLYLFALFFHPGLCASFLSNLIYSIGNKMFLYILTEKYSKQIYLILTINSDPNWFLQLHSKIISLSQLLLSPLAKKGSFTLTLFASLKTLQRNTTTHTSALSVEVISYLYYSKL